MPSRAAIDQLGERLRVGISHDDLLALDAYRRSFRDDYDRVVAMLRNDLGVEVSGRPAKSTPAIVAKLRRGSMRLSQMQDVAGCRVVIADPRAQDGLVARMAKWGRASVADRREKPSYGYRAVHVTLRPVSLPIEIQVRTELQHLWAELSEKASDQFGLEVKYGRGPAPIIELLNEVSLCVAALEDGERKREELSSSIQELRLFPRAGSKLASDALKTSPSILRESTSELTAKIQSLEGMHRWGNSQLQAIRQRLLDLMRSMIEQLGDKK